MVVMAPADENECRQMLYTGVTLDGPSAVRYPRGHGPGRADRHRDAGAAARQGGAAAPRQRVALLAFGAMVPVAEQVAAELDATVVNMRFVKPLDEEMVLAMAESHGTLVTLEDNALMGGAGSAVGECLAAHRVLMPLLNLGIPDHFIEHGSRNECLAAPVWMRPPVTGIVRAWQRRPELRTVGEA
jgi:1-deoxy-D-xylulose-5-phosphate synthase